MNRNIEKILDKIIIKEPYLHFEKRGCQLDSELLDYAADIIYNKIVNTVESLCILGSSGLALGIYVSIKSNLPTYFYCSRGWPETQDHKTYYIFPIVKENRKEEKSKTTILIDSHFRTSNTWGACEKYLRRYKLLDPIAIGFLFNPDLNEGRKDSVLNVIYVIKASKYIEKIIGPDNSDEIGKILNPTSKFWDETLPELEIIEREKQYLSRILLEFQKKGEMPKFRLITKDKSIHTRLSRIPITDPGIWEIFMDHGLLKDLCNEIISAGFINNVGYLIGISYLGSAFAYYLSYFLLQKGINVRVYNSYDTPALLPYQKEYFPDNKDIFLCQVRLTTGLWAYNALSKIDCQHSNEINLLSIRTNLKIENERRKRPLYQLERFGVNNFLTFFFEK
ncbi:MAG: hypothetical protein GYA51_01000 [Candidatus Methanofastidiosa archaeon]|nr:hypothetical protein [Candidatus Methanofastidiosa archaeon]